VRGKLAQVRWALLYMERWLKAPMVKEDGTTIERNCGTPQGGVVSPNFGHQHTRHTKLLSWLRDRQVHAVRGKFGHALCVVIVVLVCAVVFSAIYKVEVKGLLFGVEGYCLQLVAEFRQVSGSVWKSVSINQPPVEKNLPGKHDGSNLFRSWVDDFIPKHKSIGFENGADGMVSLRTNCADVVLRIYDIVVGADKFIFGEAARQFLCLKVLHDLLCWRGSIVAEMLYEHPSTAIWQSVTESVRFDSLHSNERPLTHLERFAVGLVGFNHLLELPVVYPSDLNADEQQRDLKNPMPESAALPKWRWVLVCIGVAMFAWGRWMTSVTTRNISRRIGIFAVIATIAGVILAFGSVLL
jgi:hypothetical protein